MNKKSLLNNLKTTKKANVIKAGAKNGGTSTRKTVAVRNKAATRPKMAGPGI